MRAADGAWTQSRDVGYFVGGKATHDTDASVQSGTTLALSGFTTFNMTSGELTNSSTDGLLLFIGGSTSPVATTDGGWQSLDFANLQRHVHPVSSMPAVGSPQADINSQEVVHPACFGRLADEKGKILRGGCPRA